MGRMSKTLSPIPSARSVSALQQSWEIMKAPPVGQDSPGGPEKDPESERRQADMDLSASLTNPHSNNFHSEIRAPLEECWAKIKDLILRPGMAVEDKHAKKTHGKVKKVRDAIEDALIEVHRRGDHTSGPGKPLDDDTSGQDEKTSLF